VCVLAASVNFAVNGRQMQIHREQRDRQTDEHTDIDKHTDKHREMMLQLMLIQSSSHDEDMCLD